MTSPGATRLPVSTRSHEVYTPGEIADWARKCMGGIDLDPASCAMANCIVGAEHIWTQDDDGLRQPWWGRVWLNPPFNGGLLRRFARRLISEVEAGNVTSAVFLGPVVGGSTWPDELYRVADWVAPLRQHLPWGGPKSVGGALGHHLWGFGCEPAPINTDLIVAVYHRVSAERTLFGPR